MTKRKAKEGSHEGIDILIGFVLGLFVAAVMGYIGYDSGYRTGMREQDIYTTCIYEQTHYNSLATDFEEQVCRQMAREKS